MSTHKNTSKDRKMLDEVGDVMRLHHYSIHTERTYCGWIKRYNTVPPYDQPARFT